MKRSEATVVLGLRPGATDDEVVHAFRALARDHHPDHGGDPLTFEQLVLARQTLLATARRASPPLRFEQPRVQSRNRQKRRVRALARRFGFSIPRRVR